jgi:hypothetical protein
MGHLFTSGAVPTSPTRRAWYAARTSARRPSPPARTCWLSCATLCRRAGFKRWHRGSCQHPREREREREREEQRCGSCVLARPADPSINALSQRCYQWASRVALHGAVLARRLNALALLFPPKLSSHTHTWNRRYDDTTELCSC